MEFLSSILPRSILGKNPKLTEEEEYAKYPVNLSTFLVTATLGEGGYGKVLCAMCLIDSKPYAIKQIAKSHIIKKRHGVAAVFTELNSLRSLPPHPFITGLHFAFQDTRHLYIVLDLRKAGDMRYYMEVHDVCFSESDVCFMLLALSSALEHIHVHGIIHRDIKPENIIFDYNGHPSITDFGISYQQHDTAYEIICNKTSGTPNYSAPEIMTKLHTHGIEVDYWGLGMVMYEMLYGMRAYTGRCPKHLVEFSQILEDVQIYRKVSKVEKVRKKLHSVEVDDEVIAALESKFQQFDISLQNIPYQSFNAPLDHESVDGPITVDDVETLERTHTVLQLMKKYHNQVMPEPYSFPMYEHFAFDENYPDRVEYVISKAGIDCIQRMLDVRPCHRYGFHDIRHHPWIVKEMKILRGLETYTPQFQPGNNFMYQRVTNPSGIIVEDVSNGSSNVAAEEEVNLAADEKPVDYFTDFFYIRPTLAKEMES